ncbi:Hypothetical_protein [Hexamita inflata]|uniref:Hypothetical_protein n=1 Tax=Hexamita inflata TaxID=28002 RepID=A0AA86QUE6_9EUKA|nr:Hypothetical protein HINF_LOCUS47468 [Hexamita inflata]
MMDGQEYWKRFSQQATDLQRKLKAVVVSRKLNWKQLSKCNKQSMLIKNYQNFINLKMVPSSLFTHLIQFIIIQHQKSIIIFFIQEITDSFLSKHFCLAVARANEEAKLRHTSLITNALHDETLAIQHGQKYTATPLKEGHRMSQNNNNRKRFRHDTDYSSIFYHYKMTRIYNHSFYIQYTTYAFYVRIWGLP